MTLDTEKLANLDKEVAVISERLNTIQNNHLYHIEKDMNMIKRVLWSVGFLVFSNLLGIIISIIY
jgi:formiminotetrahydrofolate cyclodeaminase|tara:strand:- start:932 stop:1126 length:195 start_codon:yes stop_codon:yes gene_type:complete